MDGFSRRRARSGRLILLPWHIGHACDLTTGVAAEVARLRMLLVESVDHARRELREILGIDMEAKELRAIPERPDPAFLRWLVAVLAREDVGLMASGGIPAFIDPGAWLVAALRERGVELVPRAGASCLGTMLSLSGIEWRNKAHSSFSFAFFLDGPPGCSEERAFRRIARRREPLFVFLRPTRVERCLRVLRDEVGERPVSLFFDLTKGRSRRFPLSDEVRTMTCAEWLVALPKLPWKRISDVALMLGP
jgi:16S rRNA C1402 (ribose-2'-O) methylase RsmI